MNGWIDGSQWFDGWVGKQIGRWLSTWLSGWVDVVEKVYGWFGEDYISVCRSTSCLNEAYIVQTSNPRDILRTKLFGF